MENIEISKKLLKEIIKYIEEVEVQIDGEWGSCRSLKELVKDEDMPNLYNKLVKLNK